MRFANKHSVRCQDNPYHNFGTEKILKILCLSLNGRRVKIPGDLSQ